MARAIVRFSLDSDSGSKVNAAVSTLLKDAGFDKVGTATYEGYEKPPEDLLEALGAVTAKLRGMPEGVSLDHLWIYVDSTFP